MSRFCLLCVVLALGNGCSCKAAPRAEAPVRPIEVATEPLDPALFDAAGRLLPSDQVLFGLTMPVGLVRGAAAEGVEVFEGVLPMRAVHAYFRAHLVSGEIVAAGDALRFVAARPVTANGVGTDRLDVEVMPAGQGTVRVRVTRRVYETRTRSEAETRRAISDAWHRQD